MTPKPPISIFWLAEPRMRSWVLLVAALPVVLPAHTPNNSVYILWGPESYQFYGLFPRVSRHRDSDGISRQPISLNACPNAPRHQEFVRLFSPKILERLAEDAFRALFICFRSPPGEGKTTLLRHSHQLLCEVFWNARRNAGHELRSYSVSFLSK